jgi:hypothetical protein
MDRRHARSGILFAYADNYLIDVKVGVIMDVEASRAIRQAEVGAAKTMIERTEARFNIKPERLAADTAYGEAPTLHWLVDEKQIAPHIPVIDKSKRDDGTKSALSGHQSCQRLPSSPRGWLRKYRWRYSRPAAGCCDQSERIRPHQL